MKKVFFLYITLVSLLTACNNADYSTEVFTTLLSNHNNEASCVFLTQDEKNNPVVSWTEIDKKGDKFFYFANWESASKKFGSAISIPIEQNTSIHEEGMPKIAFKGDGAIVATFETSVPSPKSRFGLGDIQYVMSFDKGKTWTKHESIQPDSSRIGSRSFGNIIRLDDGEAGIAWLDDNGGNAMGGRPVKFAKTNGKNGFGKAVLLESQACQCCRTALSSDGKGNVNVVFRDLLSGDVRDISVCSSTDNGATFKKSVPFSNDHWVVNGCPHNGPSVVSSDDKTYVTWYTGSQQNGVYYAALDKQNNMLMKRQLDPNGRFVQLCLMPNGSRIAAYNSTYSEKDSVYSKIVVTRMEDDDFYEQEITLPMAHASYPVLQPSGDQHFIVAWSDNDKIYYSEMHTNVIKNIPNKEVKAAVAFKPADALPKLSHLYDPVCGMKINEKTASDTTLYKKQIIGFCSSKCKDMFLKEREKYGLKKEI